MGKYTIELSKHASKDLSFHKKSGDKASQKRIENIFTDFVEHPFSGVGNPEELKHNLSGFWSRKINKKDRLVYAVNEDVVTVFVVSAKGHYEGK